MITEPSIDVIAVGVPERVRVELRDQLIDLNYEVNLIIDPDWAESPASVPGDAIACVLSADRAEREQVVSRLSAVGPKPRIAVIAGSAVTWNAALLGSFNEVVTWPCTPAELVFRLGRALGCPGNPSPGRPLSDDDELRRRFACFNLVGGSRRFLQFVGLLARVAECDAPVLIGGATGTGKELAARAIHYLGARRDRPFVPVSCGAIPDTLFENELFGHTKGAFTDARQNQVGLVDRAEGGTLFLDEVDALSLKGQVALLRFLQDHLFSPLGSAALKQADVRIIAATNTDLNRQCDEGSFRRDLLFRLNIMELVAPPLRYRGGDVDLLAEHFVRKFSAMHKLPYRPIDPAVKAWMQGYDWPGNVRELENRIHRAVLTSDGSWITLASLSVGEESTGDPGHSLLDGEFNEAKARVIEQFERTYLSNVLSRADGNVTRAAELAGKERRSLGKLLKKHNIRRVTHPGRD